MHGGMIIAVERSADAKLTSPQGGGMSATYVAQRSCPPSCPLRGTRRRRGPCYAEHGRVALHTDRLNASADAAQATPLQLAQLEAAAIDRLSGWCAAE